MKQFVYSLFGVFLLILIAGLLVVEGLIPSSQSYFLWPNPQTGEATVYFKNGNSKPVETLWVGYAAWKDISQVKSKISNLISRGIVPFIQSYHFGDNGLRGKYELALSFDKEIASAIGNSFAIINLEPEWDVDEVLNLFKSTQGIQSLLNRIQTFKSLAPHSVVLSTPGLWKPTFDYSFFSSVDSKLNARAMLMHVVNSGDSSCAKKQDGSMWPYGVKSLSEGISMVKKKIDENLNKMTSAWGGSLPFEWILSDVGVTSCGWGAEGQAQIVNELIKNLDCLYASGFRGFNLRNAGPGDLWERAMGIKNEGMFTFTTSAATMNVIRSGLSKINSFFVSGQKPSCSNSNGGNNGGSTPIGSFKVNVISGSNDWWTQIEVLPTLSVQTVVFKCGSALTALERPSWSPTQFVKGLSQQCPLGSSIEVIVNSKFTYPIKYNVGASSSSTTTQGDKIPLLQYSSPSDSLRYQISMTHTTKYFSRFASRALSKLADGENIDMAVLRCGKYGSVSLRKVEDGVWNGEFQGGKYCPIGIHVHVLVVLRNGHVEKYNLVYGLNSAEK